MKVLHVIPSVSAVHGGPTIALQSMTRALQDAGVEVHVATTDDDGAGHLRVPLNTQVAYDGVPHYFFARQTQFYKFSLPLTRWLRNHVRDYDVLHLHALFSYSTMPAAFFAHRARVPYVLRPLGTLNRYGMTQHHARVKKISYPLIEQRIIQNAARMHYTSAQEEIEAKALGATQRAVVIPLGIDTEAYADLKRTRAAGDSRVRILFLARLDPKKGLERLFSAFARALEKFPRAELVIAGDGDDAYVSAVKARADALHIAHAVEWRGFVSGEAKRTVLAECDFFVLPSYSENFGLSVVEAMAAGLPVVVTPEVGIANEIAEARAGMIAENENALSDALNVLCCEDVLRAAMGARARALAAQKFSVRAMTRALIDLYETIRVEASRK